MEQNDKSKFLKEDTQYVRIHSYTPRDLSTKEPLEQLLDEIIKNIPEEKEQK